MAVEYAQDMSVMQADLADKWMSGKLTVAGRCATAARGQCPARKRSVQVHPGHQQDPREVARDQPQHSRSNSRARSASQPKISSARRVHCGRQAADQSDSAEGLGIDGRIQLGPRSQSICG